MFFVAFTDWFHSGMGLFIIMPRVFSDFFLFFGVTRFPVVRIVSIEIRIFSLLYRSYMPIVNQVDTIRIAHH